MPGSVEALVHIRRCFEDSANRSGAEALVILDLDLRNAFPSLEWNAVRKAVDEHAPALSPWTVWCHGRKAQVQLPAGQWVECDRGAEQGDPLGPAYCALTLLRCATSARGAVEALGGWAWDAWYMDDGQVVLQPRYARAYLDAFDKALEEAGDTRVAGGKFKSVARLAGPAEARELVDASWCEGAVGSTCEVRGADAAASGKILGVDLDGSCLQEQVKTAAARPQEVC